MKKIEIEAKVDNLTQVLSFVDEALESLECSMKEQIQVDVAVEEIYVNIASYAYGDETGIAEICLDYDDSPESGKWIQIRFSDTGVPYDPLKKEDPRIDMPAEEREIGGLGIFLAKKNMDEISYEYEEGQNILTMKKNLA